MRHKFIIYIKPLSKDNLKATTVIKRGDKLIAVNYLPEEYKLYEECIRNQVKEIVENANIEIPIKTAITITRLDIYFADSKVFKKADYFNYTKSLFDALNKYLWDDDRQIIGFNGCGYKYYVNNKELERFELEVEY